MTPPPDNSAGVRAREVLPGRLARVLERMTYSYGYPAADIATDLDIPEKAVRAILKGMEAFGWASHHPFFSEDDGLIRGSGYSLTREGDKARTAFLERHAPLTFSAEQNTGGMPGRDAVETAVRDALTRHSNELYWACEYGRDFPAGVIADFANSILSLAATGGTGAEAMREAAAKVCEHYANAPVHVGRDVDPAIAPAQNRAALYLARTIRALPISGTGAGEGWRPIEEAPEQDCAVLVYFANVVWRDTAGEPVKLGDIREQVERVETGFYQDGRWFESGTGHDMFEPWHSPDQLPTHWQPLPPTPTGDADRG